MKYLLKMTQQYVILDRVSEKMAHVPCVTKILNFGEKSGHTEHKTLSNLEMVWPTPHIRVEPKYGADYEVANSIFYF